MKVLLKLFIASCIATSLTLADNKVQSPKDTTIMTKSPFAYVNTHEIITLDPNLLPNASEEWRDNYNNLTKVMEPVQKELEELAHKFEQGKSEFAELQKIANKETLDEKVKELSGMAEILQKRNMELNQYAQEKLKAAQDQLKPKMLQAFQQVAKEGSYQAVLEGAVILVAPGADNVTSKVLSILNRDYALEKAKKMNSEKTLEPTKSLPQAPA